MKIGLREEQILGFYHAQAMSLWNATCDLRYVCSALTDSSRQIDRDALGVQLHRPFAPMLATMLHHQLYKVEPAMHGHPFAVEMKIDGERMLCHKDGGQVEWFSRSATDYTDKYGPMLTPHVIRCVEVEQCILDGEVVGWDYEQETYLSFKENRSIITDDDHSRRRTLVYIVFDIVYLDDPRASQMLQLNSSDISGTNRDLTKKVVPPGPLTFLPLSKRRNLLEVVVRPEPKKLELVRHRRIESTDAEDRVERLMDAFESALKDMEEGLMVKDLTGSYILGEKARALQLWIKMKPEFSDQTTNLDVIVLGAYYSEGKRRSGRIASLLVGVAEPQTRGSQKTSSEDTMDGSRESKGMAERDCHEDVLLNPWARSKSSANEVPPSASSSLATKDKGTGILPKQFATLVRVGGGLTHAEWDDLEKLLPFKPWRGGRRLPSYFKPWRPSRRNIPDFVIEPSESVILELKCAEINESSDFSSGLTLRFPRIEAVRHDKAWSECLTQNELKEIFESPTRKPTAETRKLRPHSSMYVTYPTAPLLPSPPSTPSMSFRHSVSTDARNRQKAPPVRVVGSYKTILSDTIPVERNMLQGIEFCVIGNFTLSPSSSDEGSTGSADRADQFGSQDERAEDFAAVSRSSANDHRCLSKNEVEEMVVANGGTLTCSPRQGKTDFILAPDSKSLRVKLLIKSGNFDIVGLPFLLRCIRQSRCSPPYFDEYIYMTQATRDKFSDVVDAFGDPYGETTSVKELSRCFRHIKLQHTRAVPLGLKSSQLLQRVRSDRECDVRGIFQNHPLDVFGGCTVYLDRFEDVRPIATDSDPVKEALEVQDGSCKRSLPVTNLDHYDAIIRLHGGEVSDSLHAGVTHVVVDRGDTNRFALLATRLQQLRRLTVPQVEKRVVSGEWVDACVASRRLLAPLPHKHTVDLHTSSGKSVERGRRKRGRYK